MRIVYPEKMQVPAETIEQLFLVAVREMLIPPGRLTAKTPQDMAEALENIGWIILAK